MELLFHLISICFDFHIICKALGLISARYDLAGLWIQEFCTKLEFCLDWSEWQKRIGLISQKVDELEKLNKSILIPTIVWRFWYRCVDGTGLNARTFAVSTSNIICAWWINIVAIDIKNNELRGSVRKPGRRLYLLNCLTKKILLLFDFKHAVL